MFCCFLLFFCCSEWTLGGYDARACNDIVYNNTTTSTDVDPETYILTQRVMGMRRIIAKFPHTVETMKDIITKTRHNYSSADHENYHIHNPAGPVSLLLYSLNQVGATMSHDFIIRRANEPDIDVLNMPWQHLKKVFQEMAIPHRNNRATDQRAHLTGLEEHDTLITKKILHSLGDKEARVYKHVTAGAAWSDKHLQEIGDSDGRCPHCGCEVRDITHVLWECQKVKEHRKCSSIADIDPQSLPCYIKHGIPKTMSLEFEGPFWGKALQPDSKFNDQTMKAIGMPANNKTKNTALSKSLQIKDTLKEACINHTTHNARQAFNKLKSNKGPPPPHPPIRV